MPAPLVTEPLPGHVPSVVSGDGPLVGIDLEDRLDESLEERTVV